MKNKKEQLSDTVHKCIMCNRPAFEYKKDKYKCSECSFVWEVKRCG